MKNTISINIDLTISFGEGIPLVDFERFYQAFNIQGVYCIREGDCETFDPFSDQVKYIGKTNDSIAIRCQNHYWTITKALNVNGNPKTRPGIRFIQYREARQCDPDGLYVFPAIMKDKPGYLVSFAEEYLIYEYNIRNGDIPEANTKK